MERLVGRDAELLALEAWLDDAQALPSTVIIEGDPGAGKTAVFRATVAAAKARSFRVLEAVPAEPEAGLANSGLIDLVGPVAPEALAKLPAPQAAALGVALLLRPVGDAPPDRLAVSVACRQVIADLAADGPLLIAIDDLQWLDDASADALRFAVRRLDGLPVAVLGSRRVGASVGPRAFASALPRSRTVPLPPLSVGALHAIVQARHGVTLDRPRLLRLRELSGGNPFYALELARGFAAGTLRLTAGEALPPSLESLVGARIAALPPETIRLLATAALASNPTVELLERVHDSDAPMASLEPAIAAGVVLGPIGSGGAVSFAHPLLASAAIAAVPPEAQRDIHRALADAVTDRVERARHLARSLVGPDARVGDLLEAAAKEAARRGAPSVAADIVAVARRATPPDRKDDDLRRGAAEAEYLFEAGDADGAASLLDELIGLLPQGVGRARLLAQRARIAHFSDNVGAGVALLRAALDEAGTDPALRAGIEEGLAWGLMLMRTDLREAVSHAESAARLASRIGDEALLAEALAAVALTRAVVGRPALPTMRRAVALEPATRGLRVLRHPSFALGYLLTCMDEFDEARGAFEDLRHRAAERGDESAVASILGHIALIEAHAGNLNAAGELASEAHELAVESGQRPMQAAALARIALVCAIRGDEDRARDAAARSLRLAGGEGFDPADPAPALARGGEVAIAAIGLLEVSLERWEPALRYLGPLSDHMLIAGVREPGELRFLIDEVEALVALGRLDEASARVTMLEEMAERTRRPGPRLTADLGRGLIAAAGNPEDAIASLTAATSGADALPLPLLAGRVRLALGRVERRTRRRGAARSTLEAARDQFRAIGASRWDAAAERDLGRIGGRASSPHELTPTEAEVARLVATGMSNKEVASALFVTPKAIEANLARIYAKRGVRSRTELARLMASEPAAVEPKA